MVEFKIDIIQLVTQIDRRAVKKVRGQVTRARAQYLHLTSLWCSRPMKDNVQKEAK